jgi:hypothetical protein
MISGNNKIQPPYPGQACDGVMEKENTMNKTLKDNRYLEKEDKCIANHSSLPESNVIVVESDNIQEAHAKNEKSRVQEIVNLHQEILGHLRSSLGKAIKIGQLLSEQKSNLAHGEFTTWVKVNISFSDRTARNYMRLFKERDKLKTENVSDLGDAYNVLKRLSWSKQKQDKSEDNKNSYMTIVFDAAGRDIIHNAVDAAKELLNIKSQSQALEFICYEWQQSSFETSMVVPIETAKRLFEETYSVKVTIKNLEDVNNHQV